MSAGRVSKNGDFFGIDTVNVGILANMPYGRFTVGKTAINLAESIAFGQKAGLDVEKVVGVISKGAAGSWQMENRHKTMSEGHYDHGFAVEWMRKDLGICLAEAKRNGARLPVTALVDQFYAEVEAIGGKRWDTSSLLALLNR